jgi:hypothetical protein
LLLGVMMHLGIAVLMSIHDFSLVMMIGYLTFWDARWVDFLDRSLRLRPLSLWLPLPAGDNPAWLLLGLAEGKQLHLSDNPAQSGWFVKDANEQKYMGTDAWNKIAEHLPLSRLWGWAVMRSLLRGGLRLAGKWTLRNPVTQPMISQQPTAIPSLSRLVWLGRVLLSIPLLALTSLIIWMNVTTVGNNGQISLTGTPREVVRYLSMKQSWGMFAPYPTDQDGWITVPAQFENGLEIDLMTGKPLSNKMTQYHWGPAMRWKKYTAEIWKSGVQPLLKAWGDYFCYRYNVEDKLPKGERLASLKIYYNWRWSHTPGEEPNDLIHTRLRQHSCL